MTLVPIHKTGPPIERIMTSLGKPLLTTSLEWLAYDPRSSYGETVFHKYVKKVHILVVFLHGVHVRELYLSSSFFSWLIPTPCRWLSASSILGLFRMEWHLIKKPKKLQQMFQMLHHTNLHYLSAQLSTSQRYCNNLCQISGVLINRGNSEKREA